MAKDGIWIDKSLKINSNWSFNNEWKDFSSDGQTTTWGWTDEERLTQFYTETKISPQILKEKIVLDARCGNGLLTKTIAKNAETVIGIDLHNFLPKSNENVFLYKLIFATPFFFKNIFDIVIANGTIHHTPNTKKCLIL